ncbi:MAG: agmatinase [Armatimonadota bacterium]
MEHRRPDLRPADALRSPRFSGVRTFMRLPLVESPRGVDLAVVGVPFDTGASFRVGARFGPAAVRAASVLLKPYAYEQGVDIFARCGAADLGDLAVVPGYVEDSYPRITEGLRAILEEGTVPFMLGGDHSITLPELRAVAGRHGPVGLLQFDSHTDTWDEYFGRKYNHGTVIRRAIEEGLIRPDRSIQVGIRGSLYSRSDVDDARALGLDVVPMAEVRRLGLPALGRRIRDRLGAGPTFLSFDIDFIDPAYAPGTGTPQVGGPATWEALGLLQECAGLWFVACDVVEVIPAYDPAEITALAAAQVVHECMALVAGRGQETTA